MTQSYTPFLTFEIDHPYFNGDSKAPISISPTRDTACFIARYGLVINKKQGAFTHFLLNLERMPLLWKFYPAYFSL